jgi:hypothetical protein
METLRETLILREAISEEVDTLVDFVGRYYAYDGIPFHPLTFDDHSYSWSAIRDWGRLGFSKLTESLRATRF